MSTNIFLPGVTRIPVSGPEPYNTLVCVRSETHIGKLMQSNKVHRVPVYVSTPFRLAGFDQRVAPRFDHSTTAWISSIGPWKDGAWLLAVDTVEDAGFDPTSGFYYVLINTAHKPSDPVPEQCIPVPPIGLCLHWLTIQVTSFVLCNEPPITPETANKMPIRHGEEHLQPGSATSLVELASRQLGVSISLSNKNMENFEVKMRSCRDT